MAERTQFSDIDFTISLLTDYDDLSSFSCGCEELDLFFHKEVNLCVKYKYVSTYSVKNKKNDILALFTLAHDSVVFQSSEDKDDFIEESCGLINNFVIGTFIEYKMSDCQFITVDSLNNPATNKFYCKNGFMNQTNNDYFHSTRRMYLPLRIYQE